jgi:hypothetical protein
MALVSIGTFLLSKEYFVIEHDFYVGLALAAVLTGGQLGFGLEDRVDLWFFLLKWQIRCNFDLWIRIRDPG